MRALLLTLAFAATTVGAGEVYRSIAPDGTVIYSDVPEGPNAEPIYIAIPKAASSSSRPAARPAAPSQQPAAPGDQGSSSPSPDAGAAPKLADASKTPTPEEKAKNCETARKRAESYNTARRLYRTMPNGEREYLSDAEIDEAKAKAAADVETWCK
jgi:hypothetical protein